MRKHHDTGTDLQQSAGLKFVFATLAVLTLASGCTSLLGKEKSSPVAGPVTLPYLKVEAGECYFLDDFLPTPDSLVVGKNSGVYIRYYNYKTASYKSWSDKQVMLAFYSRDNRCWSLFDEKSNPTDGIF